MKFSNLLRSSYCLLDRPSDLISKSIEVCYASEIGSLIFHAFTFFVQYYLFLDELGPVFEKKKITHFIKSKGIDKETSPAFLLTKKNQFVFLTVPVCSVQS